MTNRSPRAGMSLIVKTVTHLLAGFILMFGIQIVLYGHLTPGGGFSGGVIIACGFILLILAEGRAFAKRTATDRAASSLDCAGALLFVVLALGGLYLSTDGGFFRNFIPTPPASWFRLWSSGIILLANLGIGLKVGMSLLLVFSLLAALRLPARSEGGGEREGDRKP